MTEERAKCERFLRGARFWGWATLLFIAIAAFTKQNYAGMIGFWGSILIGQAHQYVAWKWQERDWELERERMKKLELEAELEMWSRILPPKR